MYGVQDETGKAAVWNFGESFGTIKDAMIVMDISGLLGVTVKTGVINVGIAWLVCKLIGKESGTCEHPAVYAHDHCLVGGSLAG
jgi:uncharacterized ion transporter superfamily protein YfcC